MNLNLKEFSIDELGQYDGKEGRNLYVLLEGKVYDLTEYNHPGGKEVFEQNGNYQDLQDAFFEVGHSSTAERLKKKYLIGVLKI